VNSGEGVPGPTPNFNLEAYIGIRKAEIGTISFGQQYNLMADFLFYRRDALTRRSCTAASTTCARVDV
jgi:predicted porin